MDTKSKQIFYCLFSINVWDKKREIMVCQGQLLLQYRFLYTAVQTCPTHHWKGRFIDQEHCFI